MTKKQVATQQTTLPAQPDAEQFRREMQDLVAPRLTGQKPEVRAYMYKLIDAMSGVYATSGIDAVDNGMRWLNDATRRDGEAQEQEESR